MTHLQPINCLFQRLKQIENVGVETQQLNSQIS